MGWWGYQECTKENLLEVIAEKEVGNCDILYHSKKNNVVYLACKYKESVKEVSEEAKKMVFAIIVVTRKDKEDDMIMMRTYSENEMPYYFDAPLKLINMLTPTNDEYANKWRNSCKEKRRKDSYGSSIKSGAIIEFEKEIPFAGGIRLKTFKFFGKNLFGYPDKDYPSFRITKWKQREFEVKECHV